MLNIRRDDIVHHLNQHLQGTTVVSSSEGCLKVRDEDILLAGVYGSHVYGLATEKSDLDIFIIVSEVLDDELVKLRDLDVGKDKNDYSYQITGLRIHDRDVDFSIYSEKLFKDLLMRFILDSFEYYTISLYRRDWMVHVDEEFANQIKDYVENCVVNSTEREFNLRKAISKESDHSFVKGKNKIVREFKVLKGIKAIFHSFRTVLFGTQIAKHNQVLDFTEANPYWKEIETFYREKIEPQLNDSEPVNYEKILFSIREEFQPKLRHLQTQFRLSAKSN